jgi:hypothetical protein
MRKIRRRAWRSRHGGAVLTPAPDVELAERSIGRHRRKFVHIVRAHRSPRWCGPASASLGTEMFLDTQLISVSLPARLAGNVAICRSC